jgi:3-deoxy-D-arabino-heptulosonate 7-phosphate (DAHP) synthase class II
VGPSPKVVEAIRAIPADQYAIYPEYDGLREAVLASLAATPGTIAIGKVLNLDDRGAHVAQNHGAVRAGHDGGQVENGDAFQG